VSDEGYTKEKADRMIAEHERRAEQLEREAKEMEGHQTFLRGGKAAINEAAEEAGRERAKAENLKALKIHHGD